MKVLKHSLECAECFCSFGLLIPSKMGKLSASSGGELNQLFVPFLFEKLDKPEEGKYCDMAKRQFHMLCSALTRKQGYTG